MKRGAKRERTLLLLRMEHQCNFLTIGRKLKKIKIINDGNPLQIYTFFSPLYADDLQTMVTVTNYTNRTIKDGSTSHVFELI